MLKRSIIILTLVLAFMPCMAGASQLRSAALGGIVPDAEMDVLGLNPALLYRLSGMHIMLISGMRYFSQTKVEDDYLAINPTIGTNNTRTTKVSEFSLGATSLGILYHKNSFGFGLLYTPSTYSKVETIKSDPNTQVNDVGDTNKTRTTKGGIPMAVKLILNLSPGKNSFALSGAYLRNSSSFEETVTTNTVADPLLTLKTLSLDTKFLTGISAVFSDDASFVLGMKADASFGTRADNDDKYWMGGIPNFYAASNGFLLEDFTTTFGIASSVFVDLKQGQYGLLRIVGAYSYNSETSTGTQTPLGLWYSKATNLSAVNKLTVIAPSIDISMVKNFDRTLTAMGFGFSLSSIRNVFDFDSDTTTNSPSFGDRYTDTYSALVLNSRLTLAVETSALSWLTIRGSIVPTLFSYSSTAYKSVDAYDPILSALGSFTSSEYVISELQFLPDIMITSGVTFKLSPMVSIDILSGLKVLTLGSSSISDAYAKERPNFNKIKQSPENTDNKFDLNFNFGLTIKI